MPHKFGWSTANKISFSSKVDSTCSCSSKTSFLMTFIAYSLSLRVPRNTLPKEPLPICAFKWKSASFTSLTVRRRYLITPYSEKSRFASSKSSLWMETSSLWTEKIVSTAKSFGFSFLIVNLLFWMSIVFGSIWSYGSGSFFSSAVTSCYETRYSSLGGLIKPFALS